MVRWTWRTLMEGCVDGDGFGRVVGGMVGCMVGYMVGCMIESVDEIAI